MWQTPTDSAELVSAFRRQFQLCRLQHGETVAFLTDQGADRAAVDAGFAAATELGNMAYEIHVRQGTDDRYMQSNPFLAPGLIDTISKADLILCFFVGFFSAWQKPAREAGARVLNVLDKPSQLIRLQATAELRSAVLAASERLKQATQVQVLSDAGTDLRWEIDKSAPVSVHYGAADLPGTIDQWGQGMVACFPTDGSAHGRVVVQPGDVWILPYARMVQSPIDIEVREGHVRSVQGGLDAFTFKYWLDSCKTSESDLDPYALSHQGWGLNPLARWDDIVRYENQPDYLIASMRSYPGSFLFSTGPSPKRKTRGHIDMPLNHCTILLDGEAVVERGRIVAPEMIVDPARAGH
jgi:2,5-dihydroxypyridine 5,6-dioxygenase